MKIVKDFDEFHNFQMLKEDLYFEYTNGYAIRGWPLMGYFDKIILEVIQHGIFHHWESQVHLFISEI